MNGVILRGRPPLLGGALTLPNIRILEEILRVVEVLDVLKLQANTYLNVLCNLL